MSKLNKDQIIHIAKLARLKINEKEIEKFQKQLINVLDYVEELNEVDTQNVKPTSQTTGLENIKREDLIDSKDILEVDEVFSGTEEKHNNYFKVSAILENK